MNNEENKIVPRLRFPEFIHEGAWDSEEIGKLFKFKQGLQVSVEKQYLSKIDGMVRFIRIIDITSENEKPRYIESPGEDHLIKNDDLFMIRYGTPGLISIGFDGVIANNLFRLIWNVDKTFNALFWFYSFQKIEKTIFNLSGSSSMPAISFSTLDNLNVLYPKNPTEQQKIASCLSSLDDLITAHTQRLDALKDHKKGLMQQLFPAEGKTVPALRFPEFKDSGEWVSEPFGKLYDTFTTNSFTRDDLNYQDGLVKNIHYGDIHTRFSTLFDIVNEIVPYINREVSLDKIKSEGYCKEGDMIFADASEDVQDIGKSIEIVNLNNEKLLAGLHTILARQKNPKLMVGFGGYLFKSNKIRNQIQRESQGAKVLGISVIRLSNIEINYPENKEEQKQITNLFLTLDTQIAAQAEKIEVLKEHKRGLMQGLFPSV